MCKKQSCPNATNCGVGDKGCKNDFWKVKTYRFGKSRTTNYIQTGTGDFVLRLFSYQLYIKDRRIWPLIYSERSGYIKYWRIGNYIIKFVKLK